MNFSKKPPQNKPDAMKLRSLTGFIQRWSEDSDNGLYVKEQNKIITSVQKRPDSNEQDLISICPSKEKNELIFAIYSLQSVNEATYVIKEFYFYFCIGALFLILILAFVYSNLITKPLKKINKTATKMAHLDFTEKCIVSSTDEIGNVAASLNFLSENLDTALTDLRSANEKLEEDIEKERQLERMRKEFISSVSHELKTPITLIDGYAVGLKDDIFEGEEKEYYLDIIIDESRKMANLVSDMLDLSQLESNNFKLILEEFILTDLITITLKKYETLIKDKSIKIVVDLIENLKINADWCRLEQVLTNFITNALRHVPENGTLSIRTLVHGATISVEIENTGSTIAEDELPKIWDKFYKIDKSRNRTLGGTGIGLSIVKNILALHNFPYGAKNTEKGVCFYFIIPKK